MDFSKLITRNQLEKAARANGVKGDGRQPRRLQGAQPERGALMRLSLDVEVMADQHEELEALFAELNEEEETEAETERAA
jgi:hypothetical protein